MRDLIFIALLTVSGVLAMTLEVFRSGWTLRVPIEALMFSGAVIAAMLLGLMGHFPGFSVSVLPVGYSSH